MFPFWLRRNGETLKRTENLNDCILNYTIKCDLNNIDFDVGKSQQYREICKSIPKLFKTGTRYFGPELKSFQMTNEEHKVYKREVLFEDDLINKRYQWVPKKDSSQGYSKVVIAVTPSGSFKLIFVN